MRPSLLSALLTLLATTSTQIDLEPRFTCQLTGNDIHAPIHKWRDCWSMIEYFIHTNEDEINKTCGNFRWTLAHARRDRFACWKACSWCFEQANQIGSGDVTCLTDEGANDSLHASCNLTRVRYAYDDGSPLGEGRAVARGEFWRRWSIFAAVV